MNTINSSKLDMEHRVGGPGYRWKRAQQLAKSQRVARCHQLDEIIQEASNYLRMCQEVERESADRKYPVLAAACRLAEDEQSFQVVKLSVLGSVPRAEVAARMGIDQRVIDVVEALFFDIGDLSHAPSWMSCHVFVPEAKFGSKEMAAKMKLAYHGGPVATRTLLDGQEELPLDEAQQIVDQDLLLHAKLQAALEFDLDAQSAEEFLKVFLDYDLQRKKLQYAHEEFQLNCALDREKRIADENKKKRESSNDAECDQQERPEEEVSLDRANPENNEQLVA